MRVFLWGFMGAGKSSVGRILAQRLDVPFVDLDDEVVTRAGRSIRRIFADGGEAEFRDLERRCLESVEGWHNGVVATGGGTPTVESNRRLMRRLGPCVWLDVPFELLLDRLDDAARSERPLFQDESAARALYGARRSVYGQADRRVAVAADDTPEDVAAVVVRHLRDLP